MEQATNISGDDTNDSISISYNALNLNHDNYEAFRPGNGVDKIDGKGGYDEVNYTDSPSGMTIDLTNQRYDGWGNQDTIANIEGVEATKYDDDITDIR